MILTTLASTLAQCATDARKIQSQMVELVPIDVSILRRLAAGESVRYENNVVSEGALPPRHVAVRSLAEFDAGTPALWCIPFLIISNKCGRIVGGCGFKSAPVEGSVEIGYGVAPSERGRGIATAAIDLLLDIADSSGIVQRVVANVLPANHASSKVLQRLGFSMGRSFIDRDAEVVVQWYWTTPTNTLPEGGAEGARRV